MRWPPTRAGRRRAGASRLGSGDPWRGSRGARRRRRRRGVLRACARSARPSCACSRTRSSCGAPARARRCGRAHRPSAPRSPPLPTRLPEARARGRARAGGRCRRSRAAVGHRRGAGRRFRSGVAWPRGRRGSAGCRTVLRGARASSARCAPRLSRATAWISSTITVSIVRNAARPLALVTNR